MRPRASIEESREFRLVGRFLLVHHHAEDVFPEARLHGLQSEVRREGAILVDGLSTNHPEGQDEVAPAVEQDRRTRGQVLDPRDRVPLDDEAAALPL